MQNRLKKLSPTAFDLWETNPDEFYLKYLADQRPPKIPQTKPMSIGSAFDAHVKSYLNIALNAGIPKFTFEDLFMAQVEEQNRAWARDEGRYVFDCYRHSGALSDIMIDMTGLASPPRMETDVTGDVNGVPIGGKPDLYYVVKSGGRVLLDWKVNGYCAKTAKSPAKGYLVIRDGWPNEVSQAGEWTWASYGRSKSHGTAHRDCLQTRYKGILVNGGVKMEDIDPKWAAQLCFYSWCLGEPIGSDFIVGIDQLVCSPGSPRPQIRVAKIRCLISAAYQHELAARIERCWNHVSSGHIFAKMTREDSDRQCVLMEQTAIEFSKNSTPEDRWFNATMRKA